jgi:hypothetical protein
MKRRKILMKFKHNKKRNAAFIYEALVRELAVVALNEHHEKKKKIEEVIKKLFSRNSILGKEYRLYKTLLETKSVDYVTAEKILYEVRRVYSGLNEKDLYDAQTSAIHHINHEITPEVFNRFVPNYKSLATVYNFLKADKMQIKNKVLLEKKIIESMVAPESKALKEEKRPIDKLILKAFVKKFNKTYGGLLEEQKSLLNKFVGSSFQEDIEIKIFINEELERIRASVKKSMQIKEVKEDEIMLENSEKILQKVDSFKKKQRYSENDFVLILKMQQLVKEIES